MLNKRIRGAGIILISVILCFCLCGCDLFAADTDLLLSPPELTGDMYPIQQALNKSAPAGYTLKYPSSGNRRSAVILEDITGDNTFEAIAFYSTTDEEIVNMNINLIRQKDGEWSSAAVQSIVAGGVDRVDFCDLDGDGVKEILVGWEIYGTSERQLAVYSFSADTLSQRMLQKYTSFLCCDLDGNDEDEVFVHLLDTTEGSNRAMLFTIDGEGVSQIAGCIMDGAVKTVNEPILSTLSSGQAAIYIDETKGAGAITEVLSFSKGELVNSLIEPETHENSRTLRSSNLFCRDINEDGILEIPVASDLPTAFNSGSEKLYYTNWCSFNGEQLTAKQITVMNTIDGYYLNVPPRWVGSIAVSRDTENKVRTFYEYTAEGETVRRLAYFRAIAEKDYSAEEYLDDGEIELGRRDGTVFIGFADSGESELNITSEELKGFFRISQIY